MKCEVSIMPKDYGYFGKGSSGYAHYQQTFNSCFGSGSGGGGGDGSGCFIAILVVIVVLALLGVK